MPAIHESDFLHGAAQIGAFIGVPPRRAFYMLERGQISAAKHGNIWVGRKSRILAHQEAAENATLATGKAA